MARLQNRIACQYFKSLLVQKLLVKKIWAISLWIYDCFLEFESEKLKKNIRHTRCSQRESWLVFSISLRLLCLAVIFNFWGRMHGLNFAILFYKRRGLISWMVTVHFQYYNSVNVRYFEKLNKESVIWTYPFYWYIL